VIGESGFETTLGGGLPRFPLLDEVDDVRLARVAWLCRSPVFVTPPSPITLVSLCLTAEFVALVILHR
jgi:hypothetical protein